MIFNEGSYRLVLVVVWSRWRQARLWLHNKLHTCRDNKTTGLLSKQCVEYTPASDDFRCRLPDASSDAYKWRIKLHRLLLFHQFVHITSSSSSSPPPLPTPLLLPLYKLFALPAAPHSCFAFVCALCVLLIHQGEPLCFLCSFHHQHNAFKKTQIPCYVPNNDFLFLSQLCFC